MISSCNVSAHGDKARVGNKAYRRCPKNRGGHFTIDDPKVEADF